MRLPTSDEIAALYTRYHTPPHIQRHMEVVAAIASELGQYHHADLALLEVAAKVHDLVRIPEQWPYLPLGIAGLQRHAEINYQILVKDFPEVAAAIRPHSLMTILSDQPFPSLEAKLIYYADKRADNHTVVSLAERLNLGQTRWQVRPEQDRRAELLPKLQTLEQELFQPIPYDPATLQEKIAAKTTPSH